MPLTRISLPRGKPPAYRRAIMDPAYRALRETFDALEGDRFMLVAEHDADGFDHGADYLGIARSDDLVIIQMMVSDTRDVAQKQALVARLAALLAADPGLPPRGRVGPQGELVVRNGVAQYVMT